MSVAPGTSRVARAGRRALPAVTIAGVAATIVVGLVLRATHPGLDPLGAKRPLGTPLPPFLMSWLPVVRWPALAAAAVAAALIALAPVAVDRVRSSAAFAGLAYLATIALGLAVNAARRGPSDWSHVFVLSRTGSFEAAHEYLPALSHLHDGVAHYVRDFPQLLGRLPTHAKGNPPGPVVAMHLLGITTAGRLTAACVIVGALCAPLAYVMGRELGGPEGGEAGVGGAVDFGAAERRGRVAAVLVAFSPSVVLFGVTSVDYAFAGLGAAVAGLMTTRRWPPRAAGCVLAGIAAFFSWVLLAIPVWAVLCEVRRRGLRRGGELAVAALAGVVGVTLVLAAVWGYDPIAILHAIRGAYANGIAAYRPYAFWLFGSPAAFLAMLGAPIVWLAARSLSRGEPTALALAIVIAVSAISGFTKAETERIWLPYVPLACVAAAAGMPARLPARHLRLLLLLLAVQAILVEILFATVW